LSDPTPTRAGRRRLLLWLALLLLVLGAVTLVLRELEPLPRPAPPLMAPERATAVAEAAGRTLGGVQGAGTPIAIVSAGGALVGGLPTAAPDPAEPAAAATAEVRLASGTVVTGPVQVDALRGLSAVDARRPGDIAALELGDLTGVEPGAELILAPGDGAPPLRVRLVGPATTPIGDQGLLQHVIELALPAGSPAVEGPVLDERGRLIGLVVRDRQRGAPAGRVYAIPAEQVRPLLERLAPTPGPPEPTRTLAPGRRPGD
jgi:hypothetical protein